jgi:hypothetical protein
MVEPVDPLIALFEADEAPRADPLFTLAVMAEVERRRALRQLAWALAYAVVGVLLLWAGWPAILALSGGLLRAFGAATPFVAAGSLVGLALLAIGRWGAPQLRFRLSLPL